ncbi:MAG: tripartite tricarboxylate transporter substrate binding protein [Burkholderiales bacterium]|nr:tripartite tricarboxylate transporter substrate binding protein [Burkholderiales bacterium]
MSVKNPRVTHFAALAALVCATLIALPAPQVRAQSARTIRLVVPYPPASGPDILSRVMAESIGRAQGVTMLVENRPGGATAIGTEAVARAAPDGGTILLVANSFVSNPGFKPQNYDVARSFDPICYLASTPLVVVVPAASPYKSIEELLAAARARPGALSYGTSPNSSLFVAFEVLKRASRVDVTFVPFQGNAPAVSSLMGGHLSTVIADDPSVVSHLKSGTLRGLVTASGKRIPTLPEVRTFKEAGINYEVDIFYGVVAPAKTPPDTLRHLQDWFGVSLKAPEVQPKLAMQGLFPVGLCGAPFGDYMRRLVEEYTRIVREAGLSSQ